MTTTRAWVSLLTCITVFGLSSCSPPAPAETPVAEPTTEVAPAPSPTEDEIEVVEWTPVDPEEYSSPVADGYDFTVAGGSIACGIHDLSSGDLGVTYGCAMTGPYTFTDPPAPTEEIPCGGGFIGTVGSPAESLCRGGLMYAGEDPSLTTPELPDFRYIAALGVTCLVEGPSIACTDDETGFGFRMSADDYELFV